MSAAAQAVDPLDAPLDAKRETLETMLAAAKQAAYTRTVKATCSEAAAAALDSIEGAEAKADAKQLRTESAEHRRQGAANRAVAAKLVELLAALPAEQPSPEPEAA